MLCRICICIEEKNDSRLLKEALLRDDFYVSVVNRKKNLMSYIVKQNFDVIIMELCRMPEPETDSLALLKGMPENPVIILLAENDSAERRAHYLSSGCDAVLNSNLEYELIIEAVEALIEKRQELQHDAEKQSRMLAGPRLSDFVSNSKSMQTFMRVVQRVVKSDTSLLILGETGVGKERLARAIHEESARAIGPFVPLNCAALPDNLLESELFGHEQGAFTGAVRARRGAFEMAHKGTIFLDEIGDMPLALQVKLLRVLQEREFQRLGAEQTVSIDVRIIAATNINIKDAIAEGKFRSDLFYRLSVISLTIPPVRERKDDIEELIKSYIQYLTPKIGCEVKGISRDALNALKAYTWPGNVRELINVVERAMLLASGKYIELEDLPEDITHISSFDESVTVINLEQVMLPDDDFARPWKTVKKEYMDKLEKAYLSGILAKNMGIVAASAKQAGMTTRSLFEKMKYHGLDKKEFKNY